MPAPTAQLPDIAKYPPTLVRYYSRLGLTNTLDLMLKWVEASSMGYNATSSALTISYSVSGGWKAWPRGGGWDGENR